jgi:hypothetical protein
MRNAAFYCVLGIGFVLTTAIGFSIGARLAYKTEMLEIEDRLATNASFIARCAEITCDEQLQRVVVSSTDIAFHVYNDMEKRLSKNWLIGTYEIAATTILTRESVAKSVRSTQQLRKMFERQGCGVDGRLCTKRPP